MNSQTLICYFGKKQYTLGNPLDPETTLGPMVRTRAADFVRAQINDAGKYSNLQPLIVLGLAWINTLPLIVSKGARPLINRSNFPADTVSCNFILADIMSYCALPSNDYGNYSIFLNLLLRILSVQ
jgi:hypothetical protein